MGQRQGVRELDPFAVQFEGTLVPAWLSCGKG